MKALVCSQEDQLARVLEKNTELTIKNTNLQKQVQQLQNVRQLITCVLNFVYTWFVGLEYIMYMSILIAFARKPNNCLVRTRFKGLSRMRSARIACFGDKFSSACPLHQIFS